jgi:hypothetical protein
MVQWDGGEGELDVRVQGRRLRLHEDRMPRRRLR